MQLKNNKIGTLRIKENFLIIKQMNPIKLTWRNQPPQTFQTAALFFRTQPLGNIPKKLNQRIFPENLLEKKF